MSLALLPYVDSIYERDVRASLFLFSEKHKFTLVLLAIGALMLLGACSRPIAPQFSISNEIGNAPHAISFAIDESIEADRFRWDFGDGVGSEERDPEHIFQDAGTFNVRLTVVKDGRSSVAENTVTILPGEAGWIDVGQIPDSITYLSSAGFTAKAFDVLGNSIVDPVFDWDCDPAAGQINASGIFTAGKHVGNYPDAITVSFERLGVEVVQKFGIEIIGGDLHAVFIEPDKLDVQVARSENIKVSAIDEAGHLLESASLRFKAIRDGDSVDSTGRFEPSTIASNGEESLVSVEVELNGRVIETVVSGIIRPGILDQLHPFDVPASLQIGDSVQLSVFGTDRFGNSLTLDEMKWSADSSDIGSITDSGIFTAGTVAGEYFEEGISGRGILHGVESSVIIPLKIEPGPAESLHILPDNDSIAIGAGSPFVVLASDAYGNVLDIEEEEYEYEYSSAGRGSEIALFIAGYEIGDFENALTVTLPAHVAGNAIEIVAQSDVNIRQRSSNIIAVEVMDQDGGGILFLDLETAQLGSADITFNDNDAMELAPSWWPDGSRLVYVSDLTGELQIYTLDLLTRTVVQVTDVAGGASMPDVSPDGGSLAFVTLEDDRWQLYVASILENLEEAPITIEDAIRVSEDHDAQHILPYWSPDGMQLLASQNTADGLVRMMIFDPALVTPPEVIGPFGSVAFGWTRDGSGIHFGLGTDDGVLNLGTINLVDLEPKLIRSSLEFLVAAWAPDDSELMAVDAGTGAAWLMDSDSSGLRLVVSADQLPARMSWRPRAFGDPVVDHHEDVEKKMLVPGDKPAPPSGALDTSLEYSAVIVTDAGTITVELYDDQAPLTVENFINLARIGFYDGLEFHRVIAGYLSQSGDPEPTTEVIDGPDYIFNDEFSRDLSHDSAGTLSMANAGSNTNGSQFFITHGVATELDAFENGVAKNCADDAVACHSVFGRVTIGNEIVMGMAERDPVIASKSGVTILSISIVEN